MEDMHELTAEQQAELLRHELEAVYGSSSYKIGRAVTWLPRHAARGLKYLLHNGPVVSVRYIVTYLKYRKIANKDYAYWACLQKKDYPEALKKWFLETNYTHTPLDLEHPKTFSEKTQWLKLYGGFEDVYPLVDKYTVRAWVKEKIGEEYLIPLLGAWDRFDEIDFDKLPDKFMLKTNHGAGWNIAVQDKSKFDKADARRKMETWLKINYCYLMGGLDVQYIHIKPRIIAEKFIENDGGDLYDYKFFCFDGEPKIILHILERYTDKEERMIFYDTGWNLLPFNINVPLEQPDLPRPKNLDKMLEIARTLSQGFTAVRVDLYALNDGSIKFGEMTFTTESGISRWHPESANLYMGSLIHLPGVDDAPAQYKVPPRCKKNRKSASSCRSTRRKKRWTPACAAFWPRPLRRLSCCWWMTKALITARLSAMPGRAKTRASGRCTRPRPGRVPPARATPGWMPRGETGSPWWTATTPWPRNFSPLCMRRPGTAARGW